MQAWIIREALASDAGAVADLVTQLGYRLTESEASARLARILPRANEQLFVADVHGRPAGWVHVVFIEHIEVEPYVLVAGLVVDREHRRLGLGRALMARAEAWTRERGCSLVRLTSSSTRAAAHRFYESIGYTNLKTQYAFAKALDAGAAERLRGLVPRVDPAK